MNANSVGATTAPILLVDMTVGIRVAFMAVNATFIWGDPGIEIYNG